jgi:hypothetical protein
MVDMVRPKLVVVNAACRSVRIHQTDTLTPAKSLHGVQPLLRKLVVQRFQMKQFFHTPHLLQLAERIESLLWSLRLLDLKYWLLINFQTECFGNYLFFDCPGLFLKHLVAVCVVHQVKLVDLIEHLLPLPRVYFLKLFKPILLKSYVF